MSGLIVFDLDGTLIDSRLDIAGSVNYMRSSMGLEPLEAERVISFVGNGAVNLVRRAIADSTIDFDEALRRMKRYYADHLTDTTVLYPGVEAGLKKLYEAGIKLAVVSNKPSLHSEGILGQLKVASYIDAVYGGDSAFPLKPEPDALIALAKQFECVPASCWMLGDHYTDLEAGRRAGFRRALALWGFGEPREETPDFQAESFPAFVEMIFAGA